MKHDTGSAGKARLSLRALPGRPANNRNTNGLPDEPSLSRRRLKGRKPR